MTNRPARHILFLALLLCAPFFAQAQSEVSYSDDFQSYKHADQSSGLGRHVHRQSEAAAGRSVQNVARSAAGKSRDRTSSTARSSRSGKPEGNNPRIGTFSTLTTKTFDASGRFEYSRPSHPHQRRLAHRPHLPLLLSRRDKYYLIGLWSQGGTSTLTMQLFGFGAGTLQGTVDSNFTPEPNKWYRFSIQVDDVDNATQDPRALLARRHHRAHDLLHRCRRRRADASHHRPHRHLGRGQRRRLRRRPLRQVARRSHAAGHHLRRRRHPARPRSRAARALQDARAHRDPRHRRSLRPSRTPRSSTARPTTRPATPITADGLHQHHRQRRRRRRATRATASLDLLVDQLPPVITLCRSTARRSRPARSSTTTSRSPPPSRHLRRTAVATLNGGAVTLPQPIAEERVHTITVTATDQTAVVEQPSTRVIVHRRQDRRPSITILANGVELGGGESFHDDVTLTWTATDLTFDRIEATLNGAPIASGTHRHAPSAPTTSIVKAYDKAGHSTTETRHFILDKTAPEVRLLAQRRNLPARHDLQHAGHLHRRRRTTPRHDHRRRRSTTQPYTARHAVRHRRTAHDQSRRPQRRADSPSTVGPLAVHHRPHPADVTLTESGEPFRDGMKFNRDVNPARHRDRQPHRQPRRASSSSTAASSRSTRRSPQEKADHVIPRSHGRRSGNSSERRPVPLHARQDQAGRHDRRARRAASRSRPTRSSRAPCA